VDIRGALNHHPEIQIDVLGSKKNYDVPECTLFGVICMHTVIPTTVGLHTKFDVSSFTLSKGTTGPIKLKMVHVALTTPI